MYRRREGLGRNRRGPSTRNTIPMMIFLGALMIVAGLYTLHILTQPQRVFGANVLKCGHLAVSWTEVELGSYHIVGCDREVRAKCVERSCSEIY